MHGTMKILDPTGHTTVKWDPDVPAEVAHARQTFTDMIAKGYQAFAVRGDNEPGRRLTSFNADAGEMILMIPQLVGG